MAARERWRNVRRARGYRVSSLGRVRSVDRMLSDGRRAGGVMLQPFPDDDGYLYVTICGEHVQVSHLVLEAFHRPRPYGTEACHGPGGNQDNRADQLRWDDRKGNARDRMREKGTDEGEGRGVSLPDFLVTAVTGGQQR